ncbi:MAG TPA: hypothetical protein VJN43_23785 [Bryobacteraceae bacterium]|nr:hypothetical protein [Bryobacteraceae bacterium]
MLPGFLLPETTIREAGNGAGLELGEGRGNVVLLTLGITRIIEQESLDVSIWGSADGNEWGAKPLVSFPQKFYCGTYQILLDLTRHADVKFLRVKWAAQRWGKGQNKPLFGFYVFVQEMKQQVLAIGA